MNHNQQLKPIAMRALAVLQRNTRPVILAVAVVALVILTATDLLACPTCKQGLAENDPASRGVAAGYFYSILFMMATPFVIIGTFGSAAYISIRRAREQQATDVETGAKLDDPTSTSS